MCIKRGEIYWADLRPVLGCEQGGIRPVLIIQNDVGNIHSPTTICAPLTGKSKAYLPTHVLIHKKQDLMRDSVVLLEQLRTIDRIRLQEKIGELTEDEMQSVDNAFLISLGVDSGGSV